jgi:hypothetical protein
VIDAKFSAKVFGNPGIDIAFYRGLHATGAINSLSD